MSDLKALRYTIESCNHCGQCKWLLPGRMSGWDFASVCPINDYYHFDAYSGQGMLNIAGEVLNGTISHSKELAELLHACTACGACDVNCKNVRDMEVLDTVYELRRDGAEAGFLPENRKQTVQNVEKSITFTVFRMKIVFPSCRMIFRTIRTRIPSFSPGAAFTGIRKRCWPP